MTDRTNTTIDLSSYITERTQDFTGREWLFQRINDWLEKEESRIFLLSGEAGTGKTAIAARLVEYLLSDEPPAAWPSLQRITVGYAHFCQWRVGRD